MIHFYADDWLMMGTEIARGNGHVFVRVGTQICIVRESEIGT